MRGRASLKDVAKEAGVSPAAVSRHLNGTLELPEEDARADRAGGAPARTTGPTRMRGVSAWGGPTPSPSSFPTSPTRSSPHSPPRSSAPLRARADRAAPCDLEPRSARDRRCSDWRPTPASDGVVFCTNRRPGPDVAPRSRRCPARFSSTRRCPGRRAPQTFRGQRAGRVPRRASPRVLGAPATSPISAATRR